MVVISFVYLQKKNNFPKFGRCGSKIGPAMPIWNSKFKWGWQPLFLSHIHEAWQNYLVFKDLQMILVSFLKIFDGFWSTKKLPSLLLHINQDLLDLGNCHLVFKYWTKSLTYLLLGWLDLRNLNLFLQQIFGSELSTHEVEDLTRWPSLPVWYFEALKVAFLWMRNKNFGFFGPQKRNIQSYLSGTVITRFKKLLNKKETRFKKDFKGNQNLS